VDLEAGPVVRTSEPAQDHAALLVAQDHMTWSSTTAGADDRIIGLIL
jgi:hypothetical protein